MRKILPLLLLLALPACAQVQAGLTVGTTSAANPVTPQMLYEVENGMIVAFAGLNAYRQSCVQQLIPQSCRQTITTVQVYTRQIPPALTTLRIFVKRNDQVNATVAYNTIVSLIANYRAVAQANGIPQGGQ